MNIDLDKELEKLREYEKDFQYVKQNFEEIYKNYKEEFIAVRNEKVYHNRDLHILLKSLTDCNIEPTDAFMEFKKDQEIIYV